MVCWFKMNDSKSVPRWSCFFIMNSFVWKTMEEFCGELVVGKKRKEGSSNPPTPNSQTLEPGEGLVTFKQVFWNFHIAPQSELNLLKFWLYVNAATFSCPLPAASYLPLPLDQRRVLSTLAWTFDLTSKWGQWRSNPHKLLYIPIYVIFCQCCCAF